MSSDQLQSIFHVDSQDLVPHYEVIRLTHHGTAHHNIAKRSIDNQQQSTKLNTFADTIKNSKTHHVKKDLSKTAYYSELKSHNQQQQQPQQINSNKESINFSSSSNKVEEQIDVLEQLPLHRTIDLNKIKEHNVSLSAFGETYNLTLRPTEGLFKNGPQNVQMWSVKTNANSTQGLEYDQIEAVSTN